MWLVFENHLFAGWDWLVLTTTQAFRYSNVLEILCRCETMLKSTSARLILVTTSSEGRRA